MHRSLTLASLLCASASFAFGPPIGFSDGFFLPQGVTVDQGRVVLNDTAHNVLRSAQRDALMAGVSFASYGLASGDARGPRLGLATGIASDRAGNLFVVDKAGNEVQHFVWMGGAYVEAPLMMIADLTAAGRAASMPSDIAIDTAGDLFVLDGVNKRVLRSNAPGYLGWTVFRQDDAWPSCDGLDVSPAGDRVVLACSGDSPLIDVPASGAWRPLGVAGVRDGELYNPQDVAILPSGLLLIADTQNARVELYDPVARAQTHVVTSPITSQPTRLTVSGDDVFITDTARHQLIALLGGGSAGADVYVRDFEGDDGVEPTADTAVLASPDIVVRQSADITLADAERLGLGAFPTQEPRTNADNFVYVVVRNRNPLEALSVAVQLFSAEPTSALVFPRDWSLNDFFRFGTLGERGNVLTLDRVAPATTVAGVVQPGYRVIGPFVWRPTAPRDALTWDGRVQLLARLVLLGDTTIDGMGLDAVRASNNVARREVTVRRAPAGVGTQNTLVVRASFPDGMPPDEAMITTRLTEADGWLNEVSRGATRLSWQFAGPYVLTHPASFYAAGGQDPLVELTTEVLRLAERERPGLFDGLLPDDTADDITRVLVVVDDATFPVDRATTRTWPYDVGGRRRLLSTSVHHANSPLPEWVHGLSHHLGFKDLHLYPVAPVTVAPRVPEGWDVMARPVSAALTAVHPLGLPKAFVPWLSPGTGVRFVPRPSTVFDETINLSLQSVLAAGQVGVIALGLTPGVTDFIDEQHFVVIEARRNDLGNSDLSLPGSGVLVYRYDTDIPQGQAPVLLSDARPMTTSLADAPLDVGVPALAFGFGVTVSVPRALGTDGRAGWAVHVRHAPGALNDLGFTVPEIPWENPDIWVDSPANGQVMDPAMAVRGDEQPLPDQVNFIYAEVHNYGDVPASDVEVEFALSDPLNAMGGEDQFLHHDSVIVPTIPARGSVKVRTAWRPAPTDDPHRCVQVKLRRVVADQNRGNDLAQRNLTVLVSTTGGMAGTGTGTGGSGTGGMLTPAELSMVFRNTSSSPRRVYYRVDGAPADWPAQLDADTDLVPAGVQVQRRLKVQPPATAPLCTSTPVRVSAWAKQVDTLERLGGTTLQLDVRAPVQWLNPKVSTQKCDPKLAGNGPCEVIVVSATSTWAKARPVVVHFEGESGASHFATFSTDFTGALTAQLLVRSGGLWSVDLESAGDPCHAPAKLNLGLWLGLKVVADQDGDGLLDKDELAGDADGDGLENVLDPDSDNDKVPDGKEKPGDSDRDGTPNVIDSDS
ncbi:MAG: hypothetical protein ACOZQL_25420 [Myxococcota bacterium]